jgi:hypothetical protein
MGYAHFLHPHTSILTLLGSSTFCTENDPLCFDDSPAVGCADMVSGLWLQSRVGVQGTS